MAYLVYRLTNTANGKSYIGITSRSLDERWAEHVSRARLGLRDSRIHQAIRKYGAEAFSREVISTTEAEDDVRVLEQHYIAAFNSYENGYNCNLGGNGHLHFPEHIRRKIGDAQRGKIIGVETRRKMSEAKLGKKEQALHFGDHTKKGSKNPRSIRFLVQYPSGEIREVRGLREFIRANNLQSRHFRDRGHSKGFKLLERIKSSDNASASADAAEVTNLLN